MKAEERQMIGIIASEDDLGGKSSLHVGLQADWLRCFRACYTCVLPRTPQH